MADAIRTCKVFAQANSLQHNKEGQAIYYLNRRTWKKQMEPNYVDGSRVFFLNVWTPIEHESNTLPRPSWSRKLDDINHDLKSVLHAIPRFAYFFKSAGSRKELTELLKIYFCRRGLKPPSTKVTKFKRGVSAIPSAMRTRPMSFREAAKFLGKPEGKDSAEWLSACVKDGSYKCESLTRQTHVFSIDQFPESVRSRILPRGTTHPNSP